MYEEMPFGDLCMDLEGTLADRSQTMGRGFVIKPHNVTYRQDRRRGGFVLFFIRHLVMSHKFGGLSTSCSEGLGMSENKRGVGRVFMSFVEVLLEFHVEWDSESLTVDEEVGRRIDPHVKRSSVGKKSSAEKFVPECTTRERIRLKDVA